MTKFFLSTAALLMFSLDTHAITLGHHADLALTAEDRTIAENTVQWVQRDPLGEWFCSGVQIAPNKVLTAAHCAGTTGTDESMARGTSLIIAHDSEGRAAAYHVTQVSSRKIDGLDLAVVTVDGQLPATQSLPMAYGACDPDSRYVVAGFGLTENGRVSNTVKTTTYEAADPLVADKLNQAADNIFERLVLKSKGKGYVCGGDSGGPVFCYSHGRLAIAAISDSISPALDAPPNPQTLQHTACGPLRPFLSATKVSTAMPYIERWRNDTPAMPNADSALTNGASR